MARKPYKYVITLTDTDRQALLRLIRNGKTERRLADRARIIIWSSEGLPVSTIQERLGCSEQVILNWRRAWLDRHVQAGPVAALQDRPRSGRPPLAHSSNALSGQNLLAAVKESA